MTQNLSKLTLSVAASAVLVTSSFALDPAITNFGYVNGGGNLTIFNASDPTKIKTIAGATGQSVGISPTGAWFYGTNDAGTVTRYNAYTGASGASVAVGTLPREVIISSDGTKAYVVNTGSDTVSVVDTATHTVTATINVGTDPFGLALSPDGSKMYVSNVNDSTLSVINTTTNAVTGTIAVGVFPSSITFSPDGTKAYVTDFFDVNGVDNYIHVIDATNDTLTTSILVGDYPNGITISSDGSKIFVANTTSGTVSVISTATNTVIQTINGITGASGISISPDGSKVYVTSTGGSLSVIDATTYAVTNYAAIITSTAANTSPFISPNLITGTLSVSSAADMAAKGFDNSVNFAGGTLRATGSFTLSNPVYLHDAFNLTYDDSSTFTTVAGGTVDTNSYNVEFSGEVSGVGGLTKSGTGVLTLSGTNTYSGGTTITGGLVNFADGANLGTANITLNGGGLQWATGNTTDISARLEAIGAGGATFDTNANDVTLASVLSGTGGVTKSGDGILTLSGANTYSGGTTITGGLVNFADGANLGTANITLNGGGLQWATGNTTDISARLEAIGANGATFDTNANNVTLASVLSGTGGITKSGNGILTLSGTNTYSGATTLNGGTLSLSGGSAIADAGAVIVNTGATLHVASAETVGSVNGVGNITLDDTLTTGGANTDDTIGGVIGGTGSLTKTGDGILTLSGTNTYSGATAINGGTLAITGDTSTSAFSVNNGGTLAGAGTVGDVTVASGGILAPSTTATLGISGNLVMDAGSTLGLNAYANGTNSKVVASGTATINGGTVAVHADSGGTWNTSTDYTILTATGGVSGTFTSVTDDLVFLDPTLTYGANDVMLNLTRNTTTYASKGSNSYSSAIGTILDGLGVPNADMQTLLNVLDGTNDAGAATMLSQLNGSSLGAISSQNSTFIHNFSSTLFARMSGGGSDGGIGLASLAFADNGDWTSVFKHLNDAGAVGENGFADPQKLGEYELWIRAVGGKTYTDGDASSNIYDATTTSGGLQTGLDKHMGDWVVGASLGYLKSDMKQSDADADTDSYQLGFYLANETKKYRLSFSGMGGIYDTDATRTLLSGSTNAAYDSTALLAEAKAAYKYHFSKTLRLEPSIGGWAQRYAQDAYTESGTAGSTLSVDKATFNSQALTTELKVINIFDNDKNSKKTLEASIGYAHEFGDVNAPLVGRFSAAPDAGSFSIASANRGRDVLTTALGGDISLTQKSHLFALINANFRENEESYSAMGGVKIGF